MREIMQKFQRDRGVLPVPPAVILPMLTTGMGSVRLRASFRRRSLALATRQICAQKPEKEPLWLSRPLAGIAAFIERHHGICCALRGSALHRSGRFSPAAQLRIGGGPLDRCCQLSATSDSHSQHGASQSVVRSRGSFRGAVLQSPVSPRARVPEYCGRPYRRAFRP